MTDHKANLPHDTVVPTEVAQTLKEGWSSLFLTQATDLLEAKRVIEAGWVSFPLRGIVEVQWK